MIRITFIVPYRSINQTVAEIFRQHPEKAALSQSILTRTVDEISEQDLQETDIVIARGYSADRIQQLSAVPLIDMTVTGFDITAALNTCIRNYSPREIAVIGPLNTIYGIEEIKDAFPCSLKSYQVDDPNRLQSTIVQALEEGADAIIAGRTGYTLCQQLGVPTVMIKSGKKTILQAIDEAIRSVRLMRQERERADRFESIMDYTFEGIISVNREGNITVANNYVRRMFSELNSPGQPVSLSKVLPQLDIRRVLQQEEKILDELVTINQLVHTVNCVPAGDAGAVITFSNISKIQELEGQIRSKLHHKGLIAKYRFRDIIGTENSIQDTILTAQKFSKVDSNIFIFGETGTGKELFAQSIHNESSRKNQPFIAINCAALAEDLLESELFGYVDGAFTGAAKGGKQGLFELAHKGTVFLDEIGDISPKLQSRLLRVLQEREIMRIGHDRVIPIDIRIISASNKNLKDLVRQGSFREDLFYRLNVLKLTLPPLRERPHDITALCSHFIQANKVAFGSRLRSLTPEAEKLIMTYAWPGNVRELSNFCERLSVLSESETADTNAVRICLEHPISTPPEQKQELSLSDLSGLQEQEAIRSALCSTANRREAAQLLNIHPTTLWRKMKKYDMA